MDTDKIPEIEMLRKAIDPGSAQFFSAQAFHKADEPRRLGSQSFLNVRTGEATGFIQELVDSGHEDALGKNVGIAVAEDGLQLFDRTQRAPNPGGQADETHRPPLEAFRERQHIDEIFQDAGNAAVIFGRHDYQSIGSENGIGEFFEAGRLFGVGSW